MHVFTFDTPVDFLNHAGPWLVAREIENALVIGIADRCAAGQQITSSPPWFATVEDEGAIVLAAIRTPPWKASFTTRDEGERSQEAVRALVPALQRQYPDLPTVMGPPALAHLFGEVWMELTGTPAREGYRARVHRLERVREPRWAPGALRPVTPADHTTLRRWMWELHREAMPNTPDPGARIEALLRGTPNEKLWIWEDGEPRAMCATLRDTPNGRCIGGVFTPPDHRARGYASSLVAAVSRWILEDGKRFPYLYTDLANPTSNKIYAALGFEPVADLLDVELTT